MLCGQGQPQLGLNHGPGASYTVYKDGGVEGVRRLWVSLQSVDYPEWWIPWIAGEDRDPSILWVSLQSVDYPQL